MSAKASTAKETTEKPCYRVTNWAEYDAALVKRGNLTVWFDENAVQKYWKPEATGKRGASFQYSETAIQTLLTLKAVYSLPYRALEGFARSLMSVMGARIEHP